MAKQTQCRSFLPRDPGIRCQMAGPHEKCYAIQTLEDGYILEVEWKFHLPKTKHVPNVQPFTDNERR